MLPTFRSIPFLATLTVPSWPARTYPTTTESATKHSRRVFWSLGLRGGTGAFKVEPEVYLPLAVYGRVPIGVTEDVPGHPQKREIVLTHDLFLMKFIPAGKDGQ